MLSSIFLLALLSTLTSALAIGSPIQRRQGCQLEPNDPDCELPLWNDATYNITFDNLNITSSSAKPPNITTSSLLFTNFTVATPPISRGTAHLVPYANSTTYLRLHANEAGFITTSPAAASLPRYALDFFKIESLAFGCTFPSTSPGAGLPINCTVSLTAKCAGIGSQGLLDIKTYVWDEEYSVVKGMKVAGLKWVDLGTYGKQYLCANYTIEGSPGKVGGKNPEVWIDQMQVVEFTRSAIYR